MCPGEVSNHKKLKDTHLRAQGELSNNADGLVNESTFGSQQEKEKIGVYLLIRHFPSKIIHLHVELW